MLSLGAVELEKKIITHLAHSFGMDPMSRGVLSSDVCTANELAFIAARQFKFAHKAKHSKPAGKGGRPKKGKVAPKDEEEDTVLDNTKFDK